MSEILDVLIITGAPGVGKSTIASAWAKKRQGVAIEADEFTTWIHNDFLPRFSAEEGKLVAELSFRCAKAYLDHKMAVVINGVFGTQSVLFFKNQFESCSDKLNLKFIWLACELNENQRRDALRKPDHQMGERVGIVRNGLSKEKWPTYVHKINSTHQDVNETVFEIERIQKVKR